MIKESASSCRWLNITHVAFHMQTCYSDYWNLQLQDFDYQHMQVETCEWILSFTVSQPLLWLLMAQEEADTLIISAEISKGGKNEHIITHDTDVMVLAL